MQLHLMTQAVQSDGTPAEQAAVPMQPMPEAQDQSGSSSRNGGVKLPAGVTHTVLPPCIVASLGIAEDTGDTCLYLVATTIPAVLRMEAGAAVSPPQLRPLKLATFYISSGDDHTIRKSIAVLDESITAAGQRLAAQEGIQHAAEKEQEEAAEAVQVLLARLHKEMVASPEQAISVSASLEQEALQKSRALHEHNVPEVHLEESDRRLLQPRPRTHLNRNRMAEYEEAALSVLRVSGGLGPLMLLGAVERSDVNQALLGYLNANAKYKLLLVQGAEGHDAVAALDCCMNQAVPYMNVSSPMVFYRYKLDGREVDGAHPQAPLRFASLRNTFRAVLEMDGVGERGGDGFVGMAVNLIHHPVSMHPMPVCLPANAVEMARGQGVAPSVKTTQFSLRQTVWYYLFGDLMVFENQAAITAFTQRCVQAKVMFRQRLLGLDGSSYNMMDVGISQRHAPSKASYNGEFLLPGVSTATQLDCPLDLRIVRDKVGVNYQGPVT